MLTAAASATFAVPNLGYQDVASRGELIAQGCTSSDVAARLAAGRWRLCGSAIVLHNGPLTFAQRCRIALLNTGPHSVLTSFTVAQVLGMTGWERDEVHVLGPAGVARPAIDRFAIKLHRTRCLHEGQLLAARRCHRIAPALVLAASSFTSPRPAVGILAAGVQQGLVRPDELREAARSAIRTRHRAVMLTALDDIEMGAQALSEIDFARLCRRNNLPEPDRQAFRLDANGRRRYLDVQWTRADGRKVMVEIDGALHLVAKHWFDDMLRQNELVLTGGMMLRFPSFVVRTEPATVIRHSEGRCSADPQPASRLYSKRTGRLSA
ncbi:MAG: hypothetical protein JWM76_1377 [Pseudonocardiales bacterium]|nr:hypothetical protein [Pseudonocardiales bacterium]